MSIKLTTKDVWLSTLLFGFVALLLLTPLQIMFEGNASQREACSIAIASAIFWGILAMVFMFGYWDLYYGYFYPAWLRPLAPLSLIIYSAFGLGLWWLAVHQDLPIIPTFAILGGLQGVAEHAFAIHILRILDKVPFLQGLAPLPVLIFSFFEYMLYWTLVAWMAWGIAKL